MIIRLTISTVIVKGITSNDEVRETVFDVQGRTVSKTKACELFREQFEGEEFKTVYIDSIIRETVCYKVNDSFIAKVISDNIDEFTRLEWDASEV